MNDFASLSNFLCDLSRQNPGDNTQILEWAAAIDPANARPLNGLGCQAINARDFEAAARYFQKAILVQPGDAISYTNLAAALDGLKEFDAELYCVRRAFQLDPTILGGFIQSISAYEQLGGFGDALAAAERGLAAYPDNRDLLFGRAMLRLREGDYANGWADFEHRESRATLQRQMDEYPEWKGESLEGKTLLVCREWGLGDQIMFSRYLPCLEDPSSRVIFKTAPELAAFFTAAYPGIEIVTSDEELQNIEPDYWIGLLSLPAVLRIHCPIPPVKVPSKYSVGGPLRVGLCWEGTSGYSRAADRSIPFAALAPLLDIPGVEFVSLQKGAPAAQNDRIPDAVADVRDIADTASVIAGLDLVITTDCMIANLAGAMGKPTWVLLAKPADWRWEHRDVTPWYPSAKLYRQAERGKWEQMIERVADDLRGESGVSGSKFTPIPAARGRAAEVSTRPCRYGEMSFFAADRYLGRSLEMYGEWSQGEADLFQRLLKPGDVVIEAGANIGTLTVALLDIGCEVYAFEPQPEVRELLIANVANADRGGAAWCYPDALGAAPGTLALAPFDPSNPGGGHLENRTENNCHVDVVPLDLCQYRRLDFIKADVEGMEFELLKGAEQTIARHRPILYLENDRQGSTEAMLPWLEAHGYRVYQHKIPLFNPANFRGCKLNVFGGLVSAMLLAVPKERYGVHPMDWGLDRLRFGKSN